MKAIHLYAAGAALCAGLTAYAAQGTDESPFGKHLDSAEAVAKSRPGSFDVYIDKPTGFAFVHTSGGWKFTRKVPDAPSALAER